MYVDRTGCSVNLSLNVNTPVVDRVKDLGVIIDSHLTFAHHIDQIVARAFTRANLIHKCFVSRDTASVTQYSNCVNFTRAFIVFVRPLIEYTSPVWSPHDVGKVMQI